MHVYHHPSADRLFLTQHAISRMNARRISREAVLAAITYGRVVYTRGAKYFVLGRNEVREFSNTERSIRRFEGLQVVCVENSIVTVFRNHDFSGLRKCKGHSTPPGAKWLKKPPRRPW